MRWQDQEGSNNVEDRRGQGGFGGLGGMRGMRMAGLPIRGKTGAIILVAVLIAGYFGYDLTPLLTGVGGDMGFSSQISQPSQADNELAKFSSVALRTTEDAWENIFQNIGREYAPTTLVLYTGATDTACGYGQSAMGPFYCPADHKVYLDLSFYKDMENKLGGGGDFALGYVLAHEVGHHVQNQLGITDMVRKRQASASAAEANRISVMNELQADCFAGVWGSTIADAGRLDPGDLEEALNTATAIGDDRLQKQSTGRVVPDSFTHGTSRQRYEWFRKGFDSGDPGQCNTFEALSRKR